MLQGPSGFCLLGADPWGQLLPCSGLLCVLCPRPACPGTAWLCAGQMWPRAERLQGALLWPSAQVQRMCPGGAAEGLSRWVQGLLKAMDWLGQRNHSTALVGRDLSGDQIKPWARWRRQSPKWCGCALLASSGQCPPRAGTGQQHREQHRQGTVCRAPGGSHPPCPVPRRQCPVAASTRLLPRTSCPGQHLPKPGSCDGFLLQEASRGAGVCPLTWPRCC